MENEIELKYVSASAEKCQSILLKSGKWPYKMKQPISYEMENNKNKVNCNNHRSGTKVNFAIVFLFFILKGCEGKMTKKITSD